MKFEIKNRWTGAIIFEADCESLKLCVQLAIEQQVSLRNANLVGADLRNANLVGANLVGADLRNANLVGADLRNANLVGAKLRNADLVGAKLVGADLRNADLVGADLVGANLGNANLVGADLGNAKNSELVQAMTSICPEGCIIGWKKCIGGVIVKLKIHQDAKRSNATGRKCRAERAEVLEVIGAAIGISEHDGKTEYRVGKTVECDTWCDDRWQECAGGIHFFITRAEAEEYQ
jgi:uncharacterized protein YjbI with pentapeptide repeats